MTRRRWIADEHSGDRAALLGAHAAHLARVLRARVGQEFDIAVGARVRRGRIVTIDDTRVEFDLGEDVAAAPELPVVAALAIIKFDRFEWAVEKLTELGVSEILPLVAARCESHLAQAAAKRVERWRRIAREAAEQSRRTAPPEIRDPVKFKSLLATPQQCRIVLAESEQDTTLAAVLEHRGPASPGAGLQSCDETSPQNTAAAEVLPPASFCVAVGPEGGWTRDELAQFSAAGWIAACLGPTILRAETAAIAAVAVLQSALSQS